MTQRSNLITGGAPTQGVNIGSGEGVYKDKCNDITLVFKSLSSVDENTLKISADTTTIYLSANTGTGGGTGGTSYTFNCSLNESGGIVTLDGDVDSPGTNKYYGTNSSNTKGFYDLPSGTTGGGVGTLQQVTDCGNTTTNSMVIGNGDATGCYSFAQGGNVTASGYYSHAEGCGTTASGDYSHAEGRGTITCSLNAHAEGYMTKACGGHSHAEGGSTTASGYYSHAEGSCTTASSNGSHAEGSCSTASGNGSHAEGCGATASGNYSSHAEGYYTTASSDYGSHAEGYCTEASGGYGSHAEGCGTTASGDYSHTEGKGTIACSLNSHAEGYLTKACGSSSHAEGNSTTASGYYSHAEGCGTIASNYGSHAEGGCSTACGDYSHAEGAHTIAKADCSHAGGVYNIGCDTTIFEIGIGSNDTSRCNAFEICDNGYILTPYLAAGTSTKVVYIDDTTGELKKGDAPSGGTGGTTYTFSGSTELNGNVVTLDGDIETVSGDKYYGTSGGTKGYWNLPDGGGLSPIASDSILSNSTTGTTIPTELSILEESVVGRLVGGHVNAINMVDIYDLSSTTKGYLSDTNNWSNKAYIGPTITDGDAGKEFYDGDYYYKFVLDNTPIRINRI